MPSVVIVRSQGNDRINGVFVDVGEMVECYAPTEEAADTYAKIAVERNAKDPEDIVATGFGASNWDREELSIREIRDLTSDLIKGEVDEDEAAAIRSARFAGGNRVKRRTRPEK